VVAIIHTETAQVRQWRKELRRHPVGDPYDPGYRRLRYIRYADDHLLGFIGPKAEAEAIKQRLVTFLRDDLKLELNQIKTMITHGRTQAARFLGYEITVQVRHLAELQARKEQPAWMQLMIRKRRRTLMVCPPCHQDIHA
jgi:hypothetical protein